MRRSPVAHGAAVVLAISIVVLAPSARAQPEARGSHAVMEWDAGPVSAAGASIRTRVIFPGDAGPFPLVGVIHGASRNGSYHLELARTLASRGFVAIVPDMPCTVASCNHDANAMQITALLAWAVTQSGTPGSMIAGKVNGERRGLIGHSWGGLSSHLTAARDSTIDSVVLFDPNDDETVGRDATSTITAPELQLLAEVPGMCNSQWNEAMITPMLPEPKLQLTVSSAGHCDAEQPGDAFCGFACGAGVAATSSIFRRYAVAWTACILAEDASMGEWLGGASMTSDTNIEAVVSGGLDSLPCHGPVVPTDGGGIATDGGGVAPVDAGSVDGGGEPIDSGAAGDGGSAGRDGSVVRNDSGTGGPSDGGCGCRLAARNARGGPIAMIVLVLAIFFRRRGR